MLLLLRTLSREAMLLSPILPPPGRLPAIGCEGRARSPTDCPGRVPVPSAPVWLPTRLPAPAPEPRLGRVAGDIAGRVAGRGRDETLVRALLRVEIDRPPPNPPPR